MIKVKQIGFILFFVIVVIILIFSNLVNLDIMNNQRHTNILTPTITKRPTLIVTNTLIPTRTAIISETISPILTVSPTPTVTQKVTATTLSMIRPKDGAEMLEVDSYSGAMLRMVTSDEFPEIENDLMGVNYLVLISDILMDRYEVTNQQFATFLNDYGNQIDGTVAWYDANDYDARIEYDGNKWKVLDNYEDHPVTEVTWYGAEAYCEAMGGRLPNELEMQGAGANLKNWNIVDYAGFAGFTAIVDAGIYPWGYEKPDNTFLNFDMNVGDTVPVGSYPLGANPVGIMDLSGNVREWMLNWYTKNYSQDHVTNEGTKGPFDGEYRSIRGGSWQDDAENVLVLKRDYALPSVSENDLGFRCVYSEFTNRLESNDIASVLIRYGKPSEIKVHFDVKEVFSEVNLFVIFDEENLTFEFIGTIPEDGEEYQKSFYEMESGIVQDVCFERSAIRVIDFSTDKDLKYGGFNQLFDLEEVGSEFETIEFFTDLFREEEYDFCLEFVVGVNDLRETMNDQIDFLTPIPTQENKGEYVHELMETNGNCDYPCWLGIKPVDMNIAYVLNYLESFATKIKSNLHETEIFVRFYDTVSASSLNYSLVIEDGEIEKIIPKEEENLEQIISIYGMPNDVMFFYQISPTYYPVNIYLIYAENNFILEYLSNNVDFLLDDSINACFGKPNMIIYPKESKIDDVDFYNLLGTLDEQYYTEFKNVSNITENELINLFIKHQNEGVCLLFDYEH